MGFAKLIFTSLIRISAINPKSKHYVTFATPRVVPVRQAKAFICRKVVPLARVTLPAEVRQLAHPSCPRPPRRVRDPNVNGCLKLIQAIVNVTSAKVAQGEGCLGCPRPYNWALRRSNTTGKAPCLVGSPKLSPDHHDQRRITKVFQSKCLSVIVRDFGEVAKEIYSL